MKIGMLAGEASGDILGARLIVALKQHCPNLVIEGIGGPAMQSAGCRSLYDIERLAVMGFIEPLMRLPDLIRLRSELFQYFRSNPPDLFIGIDAPDFNLGLERKLRQENIPVVHYVSPSVWAWRSYRIHKIAKAVDLMVTLLPFEAEFYERHQVPVCYTSHPLALQIPLCPDKAKAKDMLGLAQGKKYIALLPGSRKQEIKYMAEPFLKAALLIHEANREVEFITAHVNEMRYKEFYTYYQQFAANLPLTFLTRRSQDIMAASDAVLVTSGTATLETMLYKKPMVIGYKMGRFTYQLAKRLVKTKYIGLPNLLANELVVPELIQNDLTPNKIADHILHFLNHPEAVAKIEKTFTDVHHDLLSVDLNTTSEKILSVTMSSKA